VRRRNNVDRRARTPPQQLQTGEDNRGRQSNLRRHRPHLAPAICHKADRLIVRRQRHLRQRLAVRGEILVRGAKCNQRVPDRRLVLGEEQQPPRPEVWREWIREMLCGLQTEEFEGAGFCGRHLGEGEGGVGEAFGDVVDEASEGLWVRDVDVAALEACSFAAAACWSLFVALDVSAF
jgi:hypothetical protein